MVIYYKKDKHNLINEIKYPIKFLELLQRSLKPASIGVTFTIYNTHDKTNRYCRQAK